MKLYSQKYTEKHLATENTEIATFVPASGLSEEISDSKGKRVPHFDSVRVAAQQRAPSAYPLQVKMGVRGDLKNYREGVHKTTG